MNYAELQREATPYRNAILIERALGGMTLWRIERIFRAGMLIFFALWLLSFLLGGVPFFVTLIPSVSGTAAGLYEGSAAALILFVGSWLFFFLLYACSASSYFKDVEPVLPEVFMAKRPKVLFELALIAASGSGNPTFDFFFSRFGQAVATRLGLTPREVSQYLKERSAKPVSLEVAAKEDIPAGLEEFAAALLSADDSLRKLLAGKALDDADFVGAAAWVSRNEAEFKEHRRFWSRDALGRIPGIGKDWAYGETPLLERFAHELTAAAVAASSGGAFGRREAEEIERILSRGREANVLLVGEAGVPKIAPLLRLARHIVAGSVLPPLEHKRVFVFDGTPFVSAMKDKNNFETELTKLLSEAARAGNIIFVFDNFDVFVRAGKDLGSDVLSTIDAFLASSAIQIVAIAETSAYHQMLESNPKVRERFERVLIEGAGVVGSIPILGEEALRSERESGVFFTYPALRSIAESADRYFFEGIMPDKAIDLLKEVVPKVRAAGKRIITREDVLDLVSRKTGIAAGEARGDERRKLLKLEETLHERIVGQENAIKAISGALRRARSGIANPNRPLGSFLFLGPTGVGKTETTKALAQVFFGDEEAISRLDMSEYQTDDALHRLIGTFESEKPGILATSLREKPYGVLLLDEFEKTNKDVHDLFLQILDEGFFTDASGRRVNARNLMIIATSNAASDVIWNMKHESPEKDKDAIITEIINRAIFKPELLNRFDGVILFTPLTRENLRRIATFQLQKLEKRLEEKGLELVINDTLLDYLVSVGQDPKFGARPMNRAIQEKVEQVIAEKMLRGEVTAGSRLELTSADFRL